MVGGIVKALGSEGLTNIDSILVASLCARTHRGRVPSE